MELYLQSLHDGRYEWHLDFLTKESRFFRKITPQTSYRLYRNSNMYQKAGLDQIVQDGNLAWAFFRNNHPVLPIILRREEDVWKVHEPLSWSLFQRFEDSNKVFLKYPLITSSKDLQRALKDRLGRPLHHLATPINTEVLQTPLKDLSNWRNNLIFLYWLDHAEVAMDPIKIQDRSNDDLFFAVDIYNNLGHFTSFLKAYQEIASRFPKDPAIQANWKFYQEILTFNDQDWLLSRP